MKPISKKITRIFAVLASFAGAAAVLVYTVLYAKANVNSDTMDTLMWAYASYRSGSLFAADFAYAGFLPFGGALLMLPFVALFGVSYTAHIAGMVVFLLLFFAALIWFARRMDLGLFGGSLLVLAVCALFLCGSKFREMFCEHILYYSLSALFLMVGFSLLTAFLEALQTQCRRRAVLWGLAAFLFFTAVSSDGFQVAGIAALPLSIAFFCERFFDTKTKLTAQQNLPAFIAAALPLPAMAFGFLLRYAVTGGAQFGYANASSSYDTMEEMLNWTGKLQNLVTEYFLLFDISFTDNASLTDLTQLPALLRCLFAALLPCALLVFAFCYRKIKDVHLKRLFWAVTAVCGITVFLWFFGTISNAGWRLIPMIFSLLLLFAASVVALLRRVSVRRFGVVLCAVTVLFFAESVFSVSDMQVVREPAGKYQGLYDAITARDLSYGYGNFWFSNALFVMSGGEVRPHNVGISENGELLLENYQQFPFDAAAHAQQDGCYLIVLAADVQRFEASETYRALAGYETGTYTDSEVPWGCRVYFYSRDISAFFAEN